MKDPVYKCGGGQLKNIQNLLSNDCIFIFHNMIFIEGCPSTEVVFQKAHQKLISTIMQDQEIRKR